MSPYTAEFLGTLMLILFGNGVVANVVLARTKGHGGSWILINAGWGMAVFVGVFCSHQFSDAHINPAVTVANVAAGKMPLGMAIGYMIAQFIGAMIGAALVYVFYRQHFVATDDPDAKLACFCTAPEIRGSVQSFFCEVVGTFALVLPVFLIASPEIAVNGVEATAENAIPGIGLGFDLGALGALPGALLVFAIGMSLGGTTGYAINPARDLGPRLVHALLPIHEKRDSDWEYSWIPVLGPITGGILAAIVFRILT